MRVLLLSNAASQQEEEEVHVAAARCQQLLKEAEESRGDASPVSAVPEVTKTWTKDQVAFLKARIKDGRLSTDDKDAVMRHSGKSAEAVRAKVRRMREELAAAVQDGTKKK
jgi:hypothetical protein